MTRPKGVFHYQLHLFFPFFFVPQSQEKCGTKNRGGHFILKNPHPTFVLDPIYFVRFFFFFFCVQGGIREGGVSHKNFNLIRNFFTTFHHYARSTLASVTYVKVGVKNGLL